MVGLCQRGRRWGDDGHTQGGRIRGTAGGSAVPDGCICRRRPGRDRDIGLHLGGEFRGATGDDARPEFTILGDTVNVAVLLPEGTKTFGRPPIVSEVLLKATGEAGARAGRTALQSAAAAMGRSFSLDVEQRAFWD